MARTRGGITCTVDDNVAEQMMQQINQESEKVIKEEIDPIVTKLRLAAEKYLGEVEYFRTEVERFETILKHQKQIRKSTSLAGQEDVYEQNKEWINEFLHSQIPQEIYTAAFTFQNILNEALDQKIKMVFVYQDDEGNPELYELTSEDILTFGYSSRGKLVGQYRSIKDSSGALKSGVERLVLDEERNYSQTGLDTTYKEVFNRYRDSRKYNERKVLWEYPTNNWQSMTVASEGDIHEAYAGIVILNNNEPTFRHGLEENIGDFMDFVEQVDNISGMLEGDVTKNNIEYGIKSAGASTLGLKQMQTLAKQILADANFNKEKLQAVQKKLHDKGKTRNKRMIEDAAIGPVQEMIDAINARKS